MSHVVDPVFGCHLVTHKLDKDGYAFHGGSRAHIVAWTAVHGPVPAGKVLDHRCRRRNCANPDHLEPIDQGENERRKMWRVRAKWTHCPKGHELKFNRAVTPEGGITCRACTKGAGNA